MLMAWHTPFSLPRISSVLPPPTSMTSSSLPNSESPRCAAKNEYAASSSPEMTRMSMPSLL
jgi:hypothetical protein